jgi:hypothetical protein
MPESPYPSAGGHTAPTVDAPDDGRDHQRSTDDPITSGAPQGSAAPGSGVPDLSAPPPDWAPPADEWSAPSVVTANGARAHLEPTPAPSVAGSEAFGAPTIAGPQPMTTPPGNTYPVPPAVSGPGGAPIPANAPTPGRPQLRSGRGPRRARLQLRHIDPWTVLKFACVLSVALFFVWLITVGVLYGILDVAGVVNKVNDTVTTINGTGSNAPITPGVVFGGAAIIGVVNIILFIALSTVGSVVYNLCADLVGGIEVTLSERET